MEVRKDVASEVQESRRSLIKKVAYVAPVVLTLAASASFARAGSGGQQCPPGSKDPICN
jgi:hypothetical protein